MPHPGGGGAHAPGGGTGRRGTRRRGRRPCRRQGVEPDPHHRLRSQRGRQSGARHRRVHGKAPRGAVRVHRDGAQARPGQGEADVALRMAPGIADDRLVVREVGETAWTFYASRAYAEKHGLPESFVPDMGAHRVALLSHIATERRHVLRCPGANDVLMALKTGQAIGPLPIFDGDAHGELVRCFDPPEQSKLTVYLLAGPEAYRRPEVRAFLTFAAPRIARNLRISFTEAVP
ncbi:MAG: LysR substrate-binding domain-containing protein [Pseudomonadota bacterium]